MKRYSIYIYSISFYYIFMSQKTVQKDLCQALVSNMLCRLLTNKMYYKQYPSIFL